MLSVAGLGLTAPDEGVLLTARLQSQQIHIHTYALDCKRAVPVPCPEVGTVSPRNAILWHVDWRCRGLAVAALHVTAVKNLLCLEVFLLQSV